MSLFKPFFNNNIGICTNFYTGFNTWVQRIAVDNWGNLICGLNLRPWNTNITPVYSGVTYSNQKFIFKLSPEGNVLATNTNPATQNEGSIVNGLGFNSTKSQFVLSRHRAGYSSNATSYLVYNNTQNGFSYVRDIGRPVMSGGGAPDDYICKFLTFQSDDKLLIYGRFTYFSNNSTGIRYQNSIVRINQNLQGTDLSFNTYFPSGCTINTVKQQSDGKLLVAGDFSTYSGVTCERIVRLNLDGSRDNTFNLNYSGTGSISDIAIQSDGKIILAGSAAFLGTIDGYSITQFCRLNSDGTLDTTYPYNVTNQYFFKLNILDNNELFVSTTVDYPSTAIYSGQTVNALFKLNSDGSLNTTFNTGLGFYPSYILGTPPIPVSAVFDMVYNNGKIFNGGAYTKYNDYIAEGISGINSVDGSFGECNPIIIYPTPTPTITPTNTPTPTPSPQTFNVTVNYSWSGFTSLTGQTSFEFLPTKAGITPTPVYPQQIDLTSASGTGTTSTTITVNYNPTIIQWRPLHCIEGGTTGTVNVPIGNAHNLYYVNGVLKQDSYNNSNINATIACSSGYLGYNSIFGNFTYTWINNDSIVIDYSEIFVVVPGPTPTPTPTPTKTPTPTPTNPLFYEIVFYGTTTDEACFSPISNFPMTGNGTTFCNSTTFTSASWNAVATGNYVLEFSGQIRNVSHTLGQGYANTIDAGCGTCPTPTATPTTTPTKTPTLTPTPSPTPLVCATNFNYTVTTAGTFQWTQCNGTPFSQYLGTGVWFFSFSADGCINLSSISSNDGGIGSKTTYGTNCNTVPTPTPTGTPTPTPTTPYELYTADRYTCDTPSGPCTYVETLQIANPTALVTSKFYLDSINGYVFNIQGGPISGPYLYTNMSGLGTNNCSSLCSI